MFNLLSVLGEGATVSEQVQTAMATSFTAIQGDIVDMVLTALPIGLVVLCLSLGIRYGINFFKSIGDERGYVTYAIVVILGCLLSVIYGKISALLSNTLMLGVRSHK